MAQPVDIASALDLNLDDEVEAKFNAFKNLHLKKIKYLMGSIDAKDKEIANLKSSGKDTRRIQMLQTLKDQIHDIELINDVVKDEFVKRTGTSLEDTNDMIIKKGLGAPKRFRPPTREELENKIIDLERKLEKLTRTANSRGGNNDDAKGDYSSSNNYNNSSSSSAAQPKSAPAVAESKDSSDSNYAKVVTLMDQIDTLKMTINTKEGIIDLQQEEIVRLRARNAELVSSEEEIDMHLHQNQELKNYNESLIESLEETTKKLAESLEATLKMKSDHLISQEGQKNELSAMQKQCEKLLKQNSALLLSISEMESELEHRNDENNRSLARSKSAEAGIVSKDETVRSLQEKLLRCEERCQASEQKCATLETRLAQVDTLKDQLREKNITIKELQRTIGERDKAIANLKAQRNSLSASASAATLNTTGGGGGVSGSSPVPVEVAAAPAAPAAAGGVSYHAEAKGVAPSNGGTSGGSVDSKRSAK